MLCYDLIIVGGGLVGAGLATALHQLDHPSGLQIALIDASLPGSDDPRLFALNSTSCQFLENLRLWPRLVVHAAPIHQVHVSSQGHFGSVRLRREDVNLPALGYVVPARYIEAALNEALQSLPHCTIFRPAKLQALLQQDDGAQLTITTDDGEKILYAPIIIGADGTESTVRAQLNIRAEIFDYEQSAMVTRTILKRPHQHIAYERFNSQGAIAMLPLTGNECATIWTANSKMIAALMELSAADFLRKLQNEFGYRLGPLQSISKRHVFPLRMVRAEKAVVGRAFLLGNSAHTLHPIAAQGFNLALYEVATLAEAIMEKISRQESFTAVDLQVISAQTQKQQATSLGVSHQLSRLFSSHSPLMEIAVQIGMVGLDIATPVKKRFINSLMGRAGRVPRLLLSKFS
jgi:2-octaprenyl-6-methoxyphenol hydroxylase